MKLSFTVKILLLLGLSTGLIEAQSRQQFTGNVTAVDAQGNKIEIKTPKGDTLSIAVSDKTFILRLPPGERDTKKATKIALTDINTGDGILAIGTAGGDQKSVSASTLYVLLTKSDVAEIHQKEMEDWQKRGTTGIVSAIDAGAKNFTIKIGQREIKVVASDQTKYQRYALDSAKLSDAKAGALADIKIGDEAHVLGNRDAEGTTITAEQVVSGSFKQIAATVDSIDAATGVMTVKDLATKKSLTIKVNPESMLKKLPPEMATMLARRYQRGAGGGAGEGRGAGGEGRRGAGGGDNAGMYRPNGQGGAPGGPEGRGGRGGRGGDIKQMLDGLPSMSLADLKKGDAVMVSTTEGADQTHSTAIMLLAGVEPLLTASPTATRDIMSGWNLGGGGGGEGQ